MHGAHINRIDENHFLGLSAENLIMDYATDALFEQALYLDPADASLFGGSGKHGNNGNGHANPNGAASSLSPDDGFWEDALLAAEPVGKRDWIAKPYLMRGNITSLFGTTSLGKSTVALTWACLLALNSSKVPSRGWGKLQSPGGLRVLVYGLEEDRNEQRRRIMAILSQFDATIEDLEGRLAILGCTKVGTLIELESRSGPIRTHP
jgi:hypothetical protein